MNEDLMEVARLAVRLYAETHPRPPHVNLTQAAKMLNLSTPTVSKMVRDGRMKMNKLGLIPIGEIDRALSADGL